MKEIILMNLDFTTFGIGLILAIFGYKVKEAKEKWEFDNAGGSGTVKWPSYKFRKKHYRIKKIGNDIAKLGFAILGLGILGMVWFRILN